VSRCRVEFDGRFRHVNETSELGLHIYHDLRVDNPVVCAREQDDRNVFQVRWVVNETILVSLVSIIDSGRDIDASIFAVVVGDPD